MAAKSSLVVVVCIDQCTYHMWFSDTVCATLVSFDYIAEFLGKPAEANGACSRGPTNVTPFWL